MTVDLRVALWDETPIDITKEANFIWGIANKLRGSYMPDKYGDVIIPMTVLRRLECALERTKKDVLATYEENPAFPDKAMERVAGFPFFNTSEYDLKELLNDPDHLAANFKEYIEGFSDVVLEIFRELNLFNHIDKMNKDGCLYSVVRAFSELDLSIETFDSVKMGHIFENLIARFYENVEAGQFYTGRDIIRLLVSLLMTEGCDDIFDSSKVVKVCDQACGTGGMLSTAFDYIKHFNPSADVRLFGQELMGQTYAVGLAEMLIKNQNSDNFRHADTLKEDCFPNQKMRFVIENPPFGTPWAGADAKSGQEDAVNAEYSKGFKGRWGAGTPGGGDSQLLFLQSAVAKLDDEFGRAAIIENGSPLFTGGVSSGESQIRRWLLEQDLIEAIIAMPTDLFYNTGIATYVWILSKNKRPERKGKVQLIDATQIYHKLRKPLGNKKNEFSCDDRVAITKLYGEFEENELCKIYPNEEFLYREYTVMQPLQRSYGFTRERVENMLQSGSLKSLWDEAEFEKLEAKPKDDRSAKEQKKLDGLVASKPLYLAILERLNAVTTEEKWLSPEAFKPVLEKVLDGLEINEKLFVKIMHGLSVMDKKAEIQRETKGKTKGEIIYDKESKDTEIVRIDDTIEDYMEREVLPHVPDAKWFWEEDLNKKIPVIKTGAEIPFTRYFYKYQAPEASETLAKRFRELDQSVNERIKKLFEND